jgi:hypothetical protein
VGDSDRWFHPTRLLEYWFVVVALLLVAGLGAAKWIDWRAEQRLDRELVGLCLGSRDHAERLIAVEIARHPGLSRKLARAKAIALLRTPQT